MRDTIEPSSPSNVEPSKPLTQKKRGFATMPPDQVSELARRGGEAAHRKGTAHQFTTEEARVAGRKGGIAAHRTPKAAPTESIIEPQQGGSTATTQTRETV
jgi:general stress protein YciG